jgi:16S rRNA (adenine1518-N6/adenine1519-N6)-dimethyltransferase
MTAGLRPRKRLGQHFLQDQSYLARIVAAADLRTDDDVLEVGAGTGVLTEALARQARTVIAIELDDELASRLRRRFESARNVRIYPGNALDVNPCDCFSGPYKLVANIPYYITGPLLRHLLETACQPKLLVLMLQREVAERLVARPGALSLLGVSVQYYARARLVARVPAAAFFPRPKVDSAVVRLEPYRLPSSADARFFEVARAGFSTKRKQLRNALAAGLEIEKPSAEALLQAAGIDPTARAETLSIDDWEILGRRWSERVAGGS